MITTEKTFETAIVESLTTQGGWLHGEANAFDRKQALFPQTIIEFLRDSQPKQWDKLTAVHGTETETKVIGRIGKELELRGTLDVLHNGFTDYGVRFQLAYFKLESSLNPETITLYGKNLLHVTRQVYYSTSNNNSLDLLLSLNGIPIATAELKNHFTGQNVDHAKKQFKQDRDPRELIFRFKIRTLVHFAVDPDQVFMTTKLDGDKTRYLPFNLGHNNGAGNPPNPQGYKTAYLWVYVWAKDSWMDIVGRFHTTGH